MIQDNFYNQHFDSIQLLRGIAAIFVVFEHIRFVHNGAFGVDVFFVISGFMVMFTTHKSTKNFLTKRLIRILPLYYLMTVGTYFLLLVFPQMFENTTADFAYLIKSMLFIPFDMGYGNIRPLMGIGWTVNYEMFMYALFLVCMHISHKYRGVLCSIVLIALVMLRQVHFFRSMFFTYYSDPMILEFVLGIICYYVCRKLYQWNQEKKFANWILPVCIMVASVIFAILFITKNQISFVNYERLIHWGIPAFILVLCFFIMGLCIDKDCLESNIFLRAGVQLGNMSFSLYLMHYYIVKVMDRMVFDFSIGSVKSIFGVIVTLGVCIMASYICWYIIEKKFTKWLRNMIIKER